MISVQYTNPNHTVSTENWNAEQSNACEVKKISDKFT